MVAVLKDFSVSADERAILDRLAAGVLADARRAARLCAAVIDEIRAGLRPMPLDFRSLSAVVLDSARREADLVALFRTRRRKLESLAARIVGDPDCAEDLVQEVFERFLGAPSKLARVESLGGWVVTAVKHRCLDFLRGRGRAPALASIRESTLAAGAGTGGTARATLAEREWIESRVRRLDITPSERDAALFALRRIAESAPEILEMMDAGAAEATSLTRFADCVSADTAWSRSTLRRYLGNVRRRLRDRDLDEATITE